MPLLALSCFGAFQAALDGEPLTSFHSVKVQALLAYLALEADRPHTREQLATLLWPLDAEASARNSLRQALYELRKQLGDRDDLPTSFLLVTRQTVQFNPKSDYTLDVADFLTALQQGALQQAATRYRGELLAGFSCESEPFEEWLRQRRSDFHNQAVDLYFKLADEYLEQGDATQARTFAQRQLALEPWREEAHRQLMTALALSGERSAALAQYESCRRILAEELGVEPDKETTSLYEQIRLGKFHPQPGSRPETLMASPVRSAAILIAQNELPSRRHNLPPQATSFVGRDEELVQIATRLTDPACRLLTLVGPGGMGKTRLALQAAQDALADQAQQIAFADGIFFVALAGVGSADLLVPTIATTLDFTFYGSGDPKSQLLAHLRSKSLLLVLDNFEHLLDGAELVSDLLTAAPGVKVLATSREPLNLYEEWLFPLSGMRLPDSAGHEERTAVATYSSVQLFARCAQRVRPDFDLTAELDAVVRICRLVEGMPLGIELAAAWRKVFTSEQIADEVARNLDFLATSLRNVPARHRSMRAVFEHSWRLLTAEEQLVLQRLAIFRGGFSQDAAIAVANTPLLVLVSLAEKLLLQPTPSGRYGIHELLRQFAEEKLLTMQDWEEIHDRHCAYYVALLQHQAERLQGREQPAAMNAIEAEIENIRTAWHWAVTHRTVDEMDQASEGLYLYYLIKCAFKEGAMAFQQAAKALAMDEPMGRQGIVYGKVLAKQALIQIRLSHEMNEQDLREETKILLEQALVLLQHLGERKVVGPILMGLREIALSELNHPVAQRLAQSIQVLAEENGDQRLMVALLESLGFAANQQAEFQQAKHFFQRAIELAREFGDLRQLGQLLNVLGDAHREVGEYAEAKQAAQAALAARQAVNDLRGIAFSRWLLGELACCQGAYAEAKQHSLESLALFQQIGLQWGADYALNNLGQIAYLEKEYLQARQYFLATLAPRLAAGTLDHDRVPVALHGVARVLMSEGRVVQAAELLHLVLRHPGAWKGTKQQVTKQLAELPTEIITAAQALTQIRDLKTVVSELLASFDSVE